MARTDFQLLQLTVFLAKLISSSVQTGTVFSVATIIVLHLPPLPIIISPVGMTGPWVILIRVRMIGVVPAICLSVSAIMVVVVGTGSWPAVAGRSPGGKKDNFKTKWNPSLPFPLHRRRKGGWLRGRPGAERSSPLTRGVLWPRMFPWRIMAVRRLCSLAEKLGEHRRSCHFHQTKLLRTELWFEKINSILQQLLGDWDHFKSLLLVCGGLEWGEGSQTQQKKQ